jgi:SOS-response transcriptional repressor LexA
VPHRPLRPTSTASNRRVNALEFIRRYFVAHGASPSLREIAAAIGTSVQRVSAIVHDLEQTGDILRGIGRRSIRLPDRTDELSESELVLLARRRGLLIIRDGRIEAP